MPRYIDAEKIPYSFNVVPNADPRKSYFKATADKRDIDKLPTLSPDDVRGVGEWIMLENQSKEDTDNGNYWYTCSHCSAGDLHAKVQEVPFCWKCGARMKGAEDGTTE